MDNRNSKEIYNTMINESNILKHSKDNGVIIPSPKQVATPPIKPKETK